MTFNWGTGIALFFGTFVLAMIGLVLASGRHDPGLMQKDYYDLDIHYQARLEKRQNTAALGTPPEVHFSKTDQTVAVRFPAGMNVAEGTAKFYRSSTTGDDFTVNIRNTGALDVPADKLAPGRWHVEFDWEADGKNYFWETTVNIIGGH